MTDARCEDAGDRVIVWNGNAARRGALTPEFYAAILQATELAQQQRVRAVILTSDGEFFCAGGDLNVLISRRGLSEPERREKIDELHNVVRAIRNCPVPVIAAVKGGAAGAGASIALACDFILAEPDVKFTAAYVKAGLVPDGGLTASLARLVPRALAMEMCVLAQPVTSDRLAQMGAINGLSDDVEAAAHALADRIGQGPRTAQRVIRGMIVSAYEATEAQQLDTERDAMAQASGGEEAAEGIAAFLEKRPPSF